MGLLGGIIGGVGGAFSSIFGGIGRNRALQKQMDMIKDERKKNRSWFDRRYNEDATQRADAVLAAERAREFLRTRNRQAAGTAAVMGGTEESVAAQKAQANDVLADTTSKIAAAGANRQDRIEGEYLQREQQLDDDLRKLEGGKQSGWDMAGVALGAAASGLNEGSKISFKDWL